MNEKIQEFGLQQQENALIVENLILNCDFGAIRSLLYQSFELASEIVRACNPATGRQLLDSTRQEIEPLRIMAVDVLKRLPAALRAV